LRLSADRIISTAKGPLRRSVALAQEFEVVMSGKRILLALLGLTAALSAAGCANVGTTVPVWAGGEPAGLPARSAEPANFPNVHDLPPPRATKPVSEAEQARIEAELTALRKRVNEEGKPTQGKPGAEQGR
jgi:hypothetical protein